MKKIMLKYNELNIQFKVGFWYTICNIAQKVMLLVCTPVYTRILSEVQYGQYATFQSLTAILTVFATLNLYNSGYTAGLTLFSNDKEYTFSVIELVILLDIIVAIIISNLYSLTDNEILPIRYVMAMMIQILCTAIFNFYAVHERYQYKYKGLLSVAFSLSLFSTLFGIFAVLIAPDYAKLDMRIYSETFVWVGIAIICLVRLCGKKIPKLNTKYWGYSLKTNIPLIPHYLSISILAKSDQLMIRFLCGEKETAYYSLIYTISMMITVITNAIKNAIEPELYTSIKLNNNSNINRKITTLLAWMMVGCMAIMLIMPEIVSFMGSSVYKSALYVAPPVIASTFFIFSYNVFSSVEFFYRKSGWTTIASLFAALLNVILNFKLIPIWGYVTAGYTTLICYILLAYIHMVLAIFLSKKYYINIMIDLKKYIMYSLMIIIGVVLVSFSYHYLIFRIVLILILIGGCNIYIRYLIKKRSICGD